MSLNIGLIAIEGNCLEDLDGLLTKAYYRILEVDRADTETTSKKLDEPQDEFNIVVKAAYAADGWTVIIDPELAFAMDEDLWSEWSGVQKRRICTCVCAGAAGSYSFALYSAAGDVVRAVDVAEGAVQRNVGIPISWEPSNLNRLDETSVLEMFAKSASPYDYFSSKREYTVYKLFELDTESVASTDIAVVRAAKSAKPWWKLW